MDSEEFADLNLICKWLASITGIIYVFTAIWTVYLFSMNLLDVANLSEDVAVAENIGIEDIKLNNTQIKLIDAIARYVTLFTIATLTSVITLMVLSANKWWPQNTSVHGQVWMIIASVDTVLNLICLYLQYNFNIKYYRKCCSCLGCWKPYFIRRLKMNMIRARDGMKQNNEIKDASAPLKSNTDDLQMIETIE